MSLLSLPSVLQFAAARGQLKHMVVYPVITDSVGRFFQAYLIVLVQSVLRLLQYDQPILVT